MFAGAEDSPHELPRVMSKVEQEANYLSLVTLPHETEKLEKHPRCGKKARIPRRARAGGGQPSAPGREFCALGVHGGPGTLTFSGISAERPF